MKVGTISEDVIQQILEQNDIRQVAEDFGVVIGANNKARCPFHKAKTPSGIEKTPSLHFHEASYHCYSCGAGTKWENKEKKIPHMLRMPNGEEREDGGPNVIGFVMNLMGEGYVAACVYLMEKAGIPIPQAKIDLKAEKEKKKLTTMNINFCKTLARDKKMLAYLNERGINNQSIKTWRLGMVPQDYRHYLFKDRVEGRLVFGLAEEGWNTKKAKTIAMAYRAMNEEQEADAKYLNDYNSTLYNKSQYLYGLNEARKAIRAKGYAIVMEGYIDVIIAHQSGVDNAVATCGTSFTEEQMEKLKKVTNKILMWYDGDLAGYEKSLSHMERLMEKGFRVMMIYSDGYDPAEWMNALEQNPHAIQKYIRENARPATQVLAEKAFSDFDAQLTQLKVEVLDELMPIYHTITNESEKIVFRSMINHRLGVSV